MQSQTGVARQKQDSENLNKAGARVSSQETECAMVATHDRMHGMNMRHMAAAILSFSFLVTGAILASTGVTWAEGPISPPQPAAGASGAGDSIPPAAGDARADLHHTVIVFESDDALPNGEWDAIQAAIRANLPGTLHESQNIDPDPYLIRDEEIPSGMEVDNVISVHLQGHCVPRIGFRRDIPPGALGWVTEMDGQIEPFIHVDCDHLVRMLGPKFFGLNGQKQIAMLGEAIARVALHEWVHIATQSPHHQSRGIEKSAFNVWDLVPDYDDLVSGIHSPLKGVDTTGAR